MKIITYNVNGLRSALSKGFTDWLAEELPDIVCLQETKAQPDQIPTLEFEALGYRSFFFSAEKKGYSGVAILTRITPIIWNTEWGCRNTIGKDVSCGPITATFLLSVSTILQAPPERKDKPLK